MNIFVLDTDPKDAASMYCDKHIPKMCVELLQQLGSAVIRHGASPDQMPLTKKGTPLKGGYHNHPCTIWVGETCRNFKWAYDHGIELCRQYEMRYGKHHFCKAGIEHIGRKLSHLLPSGCLTPFAQAMPDEFRNDNAVIAYRAYYHSKAFAKWDKIGNQPSWWNV